jgi:hypothetical protein
MKAASLSPERQLASFIAKFEPKTAKLIKQCRAEMRQLLPSAFELVYDNYNFFVIGYSPTERPSDAILSIAAAANGVGLAFLHGASIPDPKKLLLGSGKRNRFIRVPDLSVLRNPDVRKLIHSATHHAKTPLPPKGRGDLIIKSISAKQRPRRPAEPSPS